VASACGTLSAGYERLDDGQALRAILGKKSMNPMRDSGFTALAKAASLTLASLGVVIVTLGWLVAAPTGCNRECGTCLVVHDDCTGVGVSVCETDNTCGIAGKCDCSPDAGKSCDWDNCDYAKTESACVAVGYCAWSMVCAPKYDCTDSHDGKKECESHPGCEWSPASCWT
jgi:hypothetical protein